MALVLPAIAARHSSFRFPGKAAAACLFGPQAATIRRVTIFFAYLIPMKLHKFIALPVLFAFSAAAPAAHAVVTTTPFLAAPTGPINPAGRNLTFKSFGQLKADMVIPLGAVLNGVILTTKGVTGGSVTATNFNPTASAFVTPGNFLLSTNSFSNGQLTPNSGAAVSGGVFTPPSTFTPGFGTAAITAQTQNRMWSVFPGTFNFTSPATLSLSVASSYSTNFTVGGPFIAPGADNSTFTVSSTLSDTYLAYDWSVPSGVPGPLPLVGGMTAFAFSRRLRRRISSAAS